MAGFHNVRYDVKRDRLTPPLDLQRQIFPWIEDQYTGEEAADWKATCDKVMEDVPETSASIVESVYSQDNILLEQEKKRAEATGEQIHSHYDIAKRGVLLLLVWLRRVILEDAALFRNDNAINHILAHDIFTWRRNATDDKPAFETFQELLISAMEEDSDTF
ncbi:hypothetical protein BGX28_001900, partial [Mortierella sp. GBA30]